MMMKRHALGVGLMDWKTYLLHDDVINVAIAIGILLLFLVIRKVFIKYIYHLFLKLSRKSPTEFFTQLFLAYEKPFQWLFVIIGIYVAVDYFPYIEQSNELFSHLIQSSVVIIIAWGLVNLTSEVTPLFFSKINRKTNIEIDEIIIPFLSKGIRLVIIAIAISIIAEVFGYGIGGFVAGLGLGGLAFALAAQDALSNLFGGFVIITERPFSIDDWILTPSVEGTVEDINFRSTKVRTFAQALVTVPNSTLANEPITNWSKMGKRRVTSTIRFTYDSPLDQVKKVVERIKDLLKTHPDIHQETIFVTFDDFKDNGAEIMLYFFTKTTVWGEYLDVKEEINFKIMEIIKEEGVSIAIPSRRLYTGVDEQNNRRKLPLREED